MKLLALDRRALREKPALGERVLRLISEGATMLQVTKDTGLQPLALDEWLHDPVRAAAVQRARKAGAAALVEQTLAIAEGELPTVHPMTGDPIVDPARDKLRISTRQWIAERRDRATWGTDKGQVTINLGGLHLDALRSRPADVPRETLEMDSELLG